MKQLTDILHILMCQKEHDSDMMNLHNRSSIRCYYYLESDVSGGEELPDHEEWKQITKQFTSTLNFSSDQEALDFIKEALDLAPKLRALTHDSDHKLNFILTLLK